MAVRSVASVGKFYRLPPDKENTAVDGYFFPFWRLKIAGCL